MTLSSGRQKRQRFDTRPPKSFVMQTIPGLKKGFRQELKRSVYYRETSIGTEGVTVQTFDSLQEVIDTLFMDYPALQPYASMNAIEDWKRAQVINGQEDEGPDSKEYWECGGCPENFIHPITEDHCAICEDTLEGAIMAKVKDVKTMGLPQPFDAEAYETWKNSQEAASE